MNPYKLWKPKPEIRLDYESDRPHHKASEAHHISSSSRTKDTQQHHPSSRGYVSEGNASTRPAQTRESPTHPSTSRSHPHPSSTTKPTYSSSTTPNSRGHKQVSSQYDVRTYPSRAPNAVPAPPPSSHQAPVAEDYYKSTRHRVQQDGTSSHLNPPGVWLPPGSAESHKSSKKHRHHGQGRDPEVDKARDADRVREMAKVKAKEDKRRLEQMKEQAQRDQEMKEEIERRRRKEARRREKEVARREEERQHGQRIREEQLKLQPTPSRDSNKAPRMAHEHRDPSRQPATTRDVRHGRVKDSDESDNSLRQAATLSRHRHHHREPHSGVPGTVLSPPSQQPPHAFVTPTLSASTTPNGAESSAMTKDIHRPPTATTILQPGERKQSKHSRTYQEAAPYPPGYAVSGSDSEHTRKDIRAKLRETSRHAHTATAGTGGTATYEPGKTSHKHGKSTGGLANWLFNRSDERRERKLSDSRKRSPTETRHEAPLVIPSLSRVDPPPVISLKAGEGPSERPGHEHTRKRTSSIPVPPDHTDTRHMLPLEQPSSATIPSHVQALMEAHAAAQPYSSIPGKPNTQSRTPVPIIPSPHPAEHKPRGLLSSTPRPTASFRVPSPAIPIPPRIHADQTDAHRHSPASVDAHRPSITAPSPAAGLPRLPPSGDYANAPHGSPNFPNPDSSYGQSRTRDRQYLASQFIDNRPMRSTKTPSPGQRLGPVHPVDPSLQNGPPQSASPLSYLNSQSLYDTSRQNHPSSVPHGGAPAAYPDTIVYPSSTSRAHVDVSSIAAHPITASNVPFNPNPRSGTGNPSPRSQTYPALSAHPQPAPAHITHRTASYDTGSTTLLEQTPSSQASVLITSNSPAVRPTGAGSSPGSRNNSTPPNNVQPYVRSTNTRHQPTASVPIAAVSSVSPSQPPAPRRSHSQPNGAITPVSPTPVSSHSGGHATEDPRVTIAGHLSTPAPAHRHMSSPDSDGLQTPSSLARSNMKLPIVSDPITPVMTSQSYQEPRKKNGFFGLFRSRSTSRQQQSEHILQPKPIGGEGQEAPATKLSSSKVSLPLQTTPPAKYSNSSRRHTPATALPPTSVPLPNPERKGGATSFAPFRLLSKRHRTMSGASAEAVDGTNAGGSTVLTSPANSTRSPTPKLPPPQRDPVQATQDWRNKEEADTRGRGTARRRRPGVTFEGYAEDHPQAEQYKLSYVARVRSR